MAKRSPIFSPEEDGHQIGYVEGEERSTCLASSAAITEPTQAICALKKRKNRRACFIGRQFVGISIAADELFLKPARDIDSELQNYPSESSDQLVAIHTDCFRRGCRRPAVSHTRAGWFRR